MSLAACDPLARAVTGALAGDDGAWVRLVRRYEPMLRRIGRQYRLAPADVEDAMQTTWVRLHPRLSTIREHAALGGWLATTMRRECWRTLQAPARELLVDDVPITDIDPAEPLRDLLAVERRDALRSALAALPERHRQLMLLLTAEPPLAYTDISDRLDIPVGSIGPIRARCLARLRRNPRLLACV